MTCEILGENQSDTFVRPAPFRKQIVISVVLKKANKGGAIALPKQTIKIGS